MEVNWKFRFINLAKHISEWSKDPSRKVGAVIVDDSRKIIATGYNGFPAGIEDNERYNNREEKYKYVVHAEMNSIYNACLNGVSPKGATLFVWGLPVCSECAKGIIQVGIKNVNIPASCLTDPKWNESFKLSNEMFKEAGIEVELLYEHPEPYVPKSLEDLREYIQQ